MDRPILSDVFNRDDVLKITNEFSRLKDHCYLDTTGAALYPQCLIEKVAENYINNIYLNPHTDASSLENIKNLRNIILKHFNTDTSKYSVIFTSGATEAVKLVAESFEFNSEKRNLTDCGYFLHLRDNHTSILGLREIVKLKNINTYYISHEKFLEAVTNVNENIYTAKERRKDIGNVLFSYPAQNNFNGFKYPIKCINAIKNGYLTKHLTENLSKQYNWYILLDAASFVSTNNLNLALVQPDFVCISFYKIFGYPTGLGALLVRNSCIDILSDKKYYGGGTVDTVLNTDVFYARKKNIQEGFEDGTISFLSIMALKHCFEVLNNLIPKTINNNIMDTISYHTFHLAKNFYDRLKKLKHLNGKEVIVFYMDSDFLNIERQGGIVTFNIVKEDGSYVGYNKFRMQANKLKIYIRTGCFCNSGSCQRHFKLTNKIIIDRYKAGHQCGGETDLIDGVPTGAIRASFGYYNTYTDVDKIVEMISDTYIESNLMPDVYLKYIENSKISPDTKQSIKNCSDKCDYKTFKPTFTLKDIIIHPIEYCGPFTITSEWNVSSKGLEYHENWKIVTEDGITLTRDHVPLMSKICPQINIYNNKLILNIKGKEPISVPIQLHSVSKYKIFSDEVAGYDCGDKVARWISEAIQCSKLRLVQILTKEKSTESKALNNKSIILTNEASKTFILNELSMPKTLTNNYDFFINCAKEYLITEIPQELFDQDWDVVIIGDHEFKVEKQYSRKIVVPEQKINEHIALPTNHAKNKSETRMAGIHITYVRCIGNFSTKLKINSAVNLIMENTEFKHSYKEVVEDKISNETPTLFKHINSTFKKKLTALLRQKKRYDTQL